MGAAYVFQDLGGAWTLAATLESPQSSSSLLFGYSVALSGDGSTMFVADNTPTEGVFVYSEPEGGWSGTVAATTFLDSGDDTGPSWADGSNAMSVDSSGSVVCLGVDGDSDQPPAPSGAYVWVEPAAGWAAATGSPSTQLVPSDGYSSFGDATAISSDGTTIGVGALASSTSVGGVVYMYSDPTAQWIQPLTPWTETQRVQPSTSEAYDGFNGSLSLSSDGSVLAVGGPDGGAFIFTESSGSWAQQAQLVSPETGPYDATQALSLSPDGTSS